jgi:hypothetical protein
LEALEVADIQKLADSALNKLHHGEATSIADAARKAVVGSGISNKSEVSKFSREVHKEIGRRGGLANAGKKRSAELAQKISEKISR